MQKVRGPGGSSWLSIGQPRSIGGSLRCRKRGGSRLTSKLDACFCLSFSALDNFFEKLREFL